MKPHLAGLLFCMFLAGALFSLPLQQSTLQSIWKQYSYDEDGFAISAPSKPEFITSRKPTASDGMTESRDYQLILTAKNVAAILG